MVKQLMSIEPEDPLASTILEDFRAYMKGFVSLPLDFPGSPYAKAVKVIFYISFKCYINAYGCIIELVKM